MLRVAVVDDDEAEARRLERIISERGDRLVFVGSAADGREGLKLVQQSQPDILVSDFFMPQLTGIEMVKRVRERNREMRIIMMTENPYFRYAQEAMRYDLTRLILKPYADEEMESALVNARFRLERDSGRLSAHMLDGQDVKNNNFMSRVLAYINLHYAEKLTLGSLAEAFYVSSCHLCKMFKRYLNRNFVDVLNGIRIQRAQVYLKNTSLKVYEISYLVGYSDLPYFTVLFKRFTGTTPSEYRNCAAERRLTKV